MLNRVKNRPNLRQSPLILLPRAQTVLNQGIDKSKEVGQASEIQTEYLEIEGITALEVDLDEDEALIVLAEDRLEETAASQDLDEDEVVGGAEIGEAAASLYNISFCVYLF